MDIKKFGDGGLFETRQFDDPTAGTIFQYIPVDSAGNFEPLRQRMFFGQTIMMTNQGGMPFRFPIKGSTLSEAVANWAEGIIDQVKEMQNAQLRERILTGGIGPSGAPLKR